MADKEVKVTIKAVDEATKVINTVSKSLNDLGKASGLKGLSNLGSSLGNIGKVFSGIKGKAGIAIAGITATVAGFNKLYTASKQSFIDGISKIGNVCKMALDGLMSLGSGFIGLVEKVTGADLSFSGLAQSALDYEQQMKNVQVITGANGKTFADLEAKAQELGRNTSFTAGQIASGMKEMAQQGWEAKDILAGMDSVTALAVVGNMELADSSYLVASALNQFKAKANEAERYANVMTNTFLNSGATVQDFGESLKYTGSLAGSMNIPIEEVGTAIGILGDNGIKGSQAGTTLRRVISNLANPTDKVAKAIEDYNLQGARQKIINGDLVGGLKEMSEKLGGLNSEQKAQAGYSIAGMYALSGFLALINTAPEEIDELYQSIQNGEGVYDTMDKMLQTVTGQMLLFVSKVQTGAKQIYDAIQDNIVGAMNTVNKFIDFLLDGDITGGFSYLASESKNWGNAIAEGLSNAINYLRSFVNGGGLSSILEIGTNIIQGICKGIDRAYKSGDLTATITSFIRQVCNFIDENAPAVEKAGKQIIDAVKQGIENNKDQINSALDSLIGVMNTWAQGSAELESLCGTFAGKLIDGFIKQIGIKAQGKAGEFWNAFTSFLMPKQGGDDFSKSTDLGNIFGNIGKWFKELFVGEAFADEVEDAGLKTTQNLNKGMEKGKEGTKQTADGIGQIFGVGVVQAIQQSQGQLQTAFTTIQNSARTAFTGMAGIVRTQFTNVTSIMRNQMVNCSLIVKNQVLNMRTAFTQQFISMASVARTQMVNVSNIIRTQAVSWGNVIRNQVQNARNALTSSFLSMASVARTQMVNISNIIRNQAMRWASIIRNQASNARNALTSSFMSMSAVVRTQMANCLSIVRSYMAQIRATVSQQMTMNFKVNKTITTTNVTKNVTEGLMATMGGISRNTMSIGQPAIMGSGVRSTGGYNRGSEDRNYTFSIPLYIDGKEVARATATYNQAELNKLEKRNKRKRGE